MIAPPADSVAIAKRAIASELGIPVSAISDEATSETLGIDSLTFIELTLRLESDFGIEIDEEKLPKNVGKMPIPELVQCLLANSQSIQK